MSPAKSAQERRQKEKERDHRMTLESRGEGHHQSRSEAQPVTWEQRGMGACPGSQPVCPLRKAEVMLIPKDLTRQVSLGHWRICDWPSEGAIKGRSQVCLCCYWVDICLSH